MEAAKPASKATTTISTPRSKATSASGKAGRSTAWSYELGLDAHSISADPKFVNPAGPDGILGYNSNPLNEPVWTSEGPALLNSSGGSVTPQGNTVSGAIQDIAVDPNNSAHIIAGSVNGGVWQTTNGNTNNPTWTPLTDQLASLSIGAVAFDPTDATGKTFYAGTGLWSNSFQIGDPAIGLYKTTDGGSTWTLLGSTALSGHRIKSLAIIPPPAASPGAPATILAGTINGTGLDISAPG